MNYYTNNYSRKNCCQSDECGTYITVQGPVEPMGSEESRGEQGARGEQGIPNPKGENGEMPVITVAESTPISYRLNFKTTEQDITTPNLFAPYSEYHANLSAISSALTVPLKNLVLTYRLLRQAHLG